MHVTKGGVCCELGLPGGLKLFLSHSSCLALLAMSNSRGNETPRRSTTIGVLLGVSKVNMFDDDRSQMLQLIEGKIVWFLDQMVEDLLNRIVPCPFEFLVEIFGESKLSKELRARSIC